MRGVKKEMIERRKQCRTAEKQESVWWTSELDQEMKRRLCENDRPRKVTATPQD